MNNTKICAAGEQIATRDFQSRTLTAVPEASWQLEEEAHLLTKMHLLVMQVAAFLSQLAEQSFLSLQGFLQYQLNLVMLGLTDRSYELNAR
ncbi:hypothetical protein LINPERPRIM_LOCUS27657 [Linum perenne]